MANNQSYLDDWRARPADLNTTAARKAPRSAHLKYGESAAAAYSKECGGVNAERVALPAGLALADVPFAFTGSGGLRSADRRAVALDDWRPADDQAREALAAAVKAAQEADIYAAGLDARIAAAISEKKLGGRFDSHVAAWVAFSEKEKSIRRAAAADTAIKASRADIAYNAGAKYRSYKAAARAAGGADAWALVPPPAVRAWLDSAAWAAADPLPTASPYNPRFVPRLSESQRLGGAAAVPTASPFNPLYMPRLSFAQRRRLARARAESKARAQEVLREEAARLGCDIDALPRIYHYIRVGALDWSSHGGQYDAHIDDWRAANHIRTDTAQVMIAAQCRRWGVAALAGPIKRTGAPYLLELRAQNSEIVRRESAAEQSYNALIGGPVLGAAPGASTGTGGMKYKISVKGTRAAGGAQIVYRKKKKKNDMGGFSDTELPLIEKEAAAESAQASNVAVLGRRLTELDAIINSCACPAIAQGGKNERARIEKSLLSVLDRDCVALDDIKRTYFYRRAAHGADYEMQAERGEAARARRAGVELVSLDAIQEAVAEEGAADVVGAAGVDCSALMLEELKGIARAAATRGRAADFEKYFVLRLRGLTQEAAAADIGITRQSAIVWEKKIMAAAASAGADAPLAL